MAIIETARQASSLSRSVLKARGLDYRSAGTKQAALGERLSEATGYWEDPASISSKPPRWILHLTFDDSQPQVHFAQSNDGLLTGASTPGYINNGQGKCAIAAVRVLVAVQRLNGQYEFPSGWEWLVQFVFPYALPVGTSGDALTEFSVQRGTIQYKGRAAERREFSLAAIYVHPVLDADLPEFRDARHTLTYRDATRSLNRFLSSGPVQSTVLNLADDEDVSRLLEELRHVYQEPARIDVDENVYESLARRLAAGERNFLSQLAPGIYRVAPPFAISGTDASSTSMATGDEME